MHCNDSNCAGGDDSITTPDSTGDVGTQISMRLNDAGHPVMSYVDVTQGRMKVLHCNDPNCDGVGEVIGLSGTASTAPTARTSMDFGIFERPVVFFSGPAFELKIGYCATDDCAAGAGGSIVPGVNADYVSGVSEALTPHIAYRERTTMRLHVIACNDNVCAGGNDLIAAPAPTDRPAPEGISMQLDNFSTEEPVIAYGEAGNPLSIVHCISGCHAIPWPDGSGDVGSHGSLLSVEFQALRASYYDATNGDMKVLRCTDVRCAVNKTIVTTVDSAGDVGTYTSGTVDSSNRPVIAYYDATNADLKVVHCNDMDCAGGFESITSPATTGNVGSYASLELTAGGLPVVSMVDATSDSLLLMLCNDANCAGNDEQFRTLWNGPATHTSLGLAPGGLPVVSFYDASNGDLRLARCADTSCSSSTVDLVDGAGDVGEYGALGFDTAGAAVISYYDRSNGDLKIARCTTPTTDCSSGVTVFAADSTGDVGQHTSLTFNTSPAAPVVTYYDATNGDLKMLTCDDAACAPGGDLAQAKDVEGDVGAFTSVDFRSSSATLVYYDATHQDLKVLLCVAQIDCANDNDLDAVRAPIGTSLFDDTCPSDPDPGRDSADGNFISGLIDTNDRTVVVSDNIHNVCDPDDDNDGLPDVIELGGPPCPSATWYTSTTLGDTDGDRFLDGAECALGTDPNSAASKPLLSACGAAGDADGDKVSDRIEYCKFNSNPNDADTDDDPNDGSGSPGTGFAKDGCEAASVNGDRVVNSTDQLLLAKEYLRVLAGNWTLQPFMDLNKDGPLNSADQLFMATFIIPTGQCP